ncbi:MAG: hypothetical protein FWD64_02825 [Acidobacteriaceae bacterium]|nr:hypothetical protein [Acidobacteriaceae bacterium]
MFPVMPMFCCALLAHAQQGGQLDMSGVTTLMSTIKTTAMAVGAVICLVGLIFAAVRFMGGQIQQAIIGLVGVIFGAALLGWGAGWIGSLTGQQVQ